MIFLIEANPDYEEELNLFKREILTEDADSEDRFAGCMGLEHCDSAGEWIKLCNLRKSKETCSMAGVEVPSTTYFAIRQEDNKLVGVIDLRHHINHPMLGTWGGHCGYTVRPSERGRGYAKEMLRLMKANAKAIGIEKMLVTCNVTNIASEKTIMANGGKLESIIDVDGCQIKRYWIETGKRKTDTSRYL